MSYKFSTGSIRRGDIYFEDDRLGQPTYIDFGMDTITLRPSGAAQLYVEDGKVGIGTTTPDCELHVAGNISASIHISASAFYGDGSKLTGISGGGGGGISFNGSTANGLVTYGNSSTADVESNLTFDGTVLSVTGDVALAGALVAPYGLTHDVVADGAIAANDVVVVSGYSGTKLKVAKAQVDALSHCRGPFYVADINASDGETFPVVSSKVITGVDTSAATNVGDKVWLGTTAGLTTFTLPAATSDDAQFSLQIEVGRVISVHASTGAYILQPPRTNSPLVGRVQSGGGSSTLVTGFGGAYVGASCGASFQGEAQTDDDQIKFVAILSANGKLQITMDNPTTNEIFTYWVYV